MHCHRRGISYKSCYLLRTNSCRESASGMNYFSLGRVARGLAILLVR